MSRYLRNIGSMALLSVVQRVLGMLNTVFLARLLGSADLGLYSIVANTASSAYGMVRLGVDAAIHVHTAKGGTDPEERRQTGQLLGMGLLLLSVAGGIAALACMLGAEWLANLVYADVKLGHWIRFAGALVLLQCLSQFCYVLLVGLHRFATYSRIMLYVAVIQLFLVSVCTYLNGLEGGVHGLITAQIMNLLALTYQAWKALKEDNVKISLKEKFQALRKIFETGIPFYLAGLVSVPVGYFMQGYLLQYCGPEGVGGLRVITALMAIVTFLPNSIAAVMISHFSKLSTQTSDLNQAIEKNLRWVWMLALAVGGGLMFVLPKIIELMFGMEYVVFIGAGQVAIVSAILAVVIGVVSNIILSVNRVVVIFFYTLMQVSVFATSAYILVPKFSVAGYFISEVIGCAGALCLAFILMSKKHGMQMLAIKNYIILTASTFVLFVYALVQNFDYYSLFYNMAIDVFLIVILICTFVSVARLDERKALRYLFDVRIKSLVNKK